MHYDLAELEIEDKTIKVHKKGIELIHDPILNKGSGFPDCERDALELRGLVPPQVVSIDDQVERVMENFHSKETDIERYIHLESLHDRNETLYYRILVENVEEITPIIYTPVVGLACQKYNHIYRRSRGMYFSTSDRGNFEQMTKSWKNDDVQIIVVSDGSRILGLGDLGTNGMGIPIGKLSLYVACAGIHPKNTLPVLLDTGTNNQSLQQDPLYLGAKHPRLAGDVFYEMVDEFIQSAIHRWPNVLIQFEDFTNDHAFKLLEKYRKNILCFNDDIQGTGSVALAGILASLRITKEKLSDQRIIFLGAGSAGIGIADSISAGIRDGEGIALEDARKQFWFLDSKGLVCNGRGDTLAEHKIPYARNEDFKESLLEVVKDVKPTILMGLSGQPGTFNEDVIREMSKHVEKPIIFALSNPTSKAECTAEQAYKWTNGQAIFASGSPFNPVNFKGKTLIPGQGNNMYIFPGVGLGAILSQAKFIPNSVFYVAAKKLAELVTDEELSYHRVYPDIKSIRAISTEIASEVSRYMRDNNLANNTLPSSGMYDFVKHKMFWPEYMNYSYEE